LTVTATGHLCEFLARKDGESRVGVEDWSFQDLTGADLRNWRFEGTNFSEARLVGARFRSVDRGIFSNADMRTVMLRSTMDTGVDVLMTNCHFEGANLQNASLEGGDFNGSVFKGADLRGSNLSRAYLGNCDLSSADLKGANLAGASFGRNILTARNFSRAVGLEYTSVEDLSRDDLIGDSVGFIDRHINWEKIRILGQLPLFGLSYISLFLLTIVVLSKNYYNNIVDAISAYNILFYSIRYSEIDYNEWIILISSLALATASTIYKLRCPERVTEYNSIQWIDGLQKLPLNYYAECWKHPFSRISCTILYVTGGVCGLYLFIEKLLFVVLIMTAIR
jgi:uncharacterized protein YjbI with pentapeptide repeats